MTPHYDDEKVTLYHGDARSALAEIPPVDLVVADPPYAFSGRRKEWQITASVAIGLHEAAKKVTKGGAMLVMTAASGRGIEYVQGAVGDVLPLNRLLVWRKSFVNSAVAGPWRWDIVPILCFGKCSFGRPQFSSSFESEGHSAVKSSHPAALPAGIGPWLVEPFTEASTVLDPFCGSGVFVTAAARAGKRVYGIDIEARYLDMTVERLGQGVFDMGATA